MSSSKGGRNDNGSHLLITEVISSKLEDHLYRESCSDIKESLDETGHCHGSTTDKEGIEIDNVDGGKSTPPRPLVDEADDGNGKRKRDDTSEITDIVGSLNPISQQQSKRERGISEETIARGIYFMELEAEPSRYKFVIDCDDATSEKWEWMAEFKPSGARYFESRTRFIHKLTVEPRPDTVEFGTTEEIDTGIVVFKVDGHLPGSMLRSLAHATPKNNPKSKRLKRGKILYIEDTLRLDLRRFSSCEMVVQYLMFSPTSAAEEDGIGELPRSEKWRYHVQDGGEGLLRLHLTFVLHYEMDEEALCACKHALNHRMKMSDKRSGVETASILNLCKTNDRGH